MPTADIKLGPAYAALTPDLFFRIVETSLDIFIPSAPAAQQTLIYSFEGDTGTGEDFSFAFTGTGGINNRDLPRNNAEFTEAEFFIGEALALEMDFVVTGAEIRPLFASWSGMDQPGKIDAFSEFIELFDLNATGTSASEAFAGTENDDTINGRGGDDTLDGDEGNDVILGGSGNDQISGDDGRDDLDGQGGADFLSGGNGNDSLAGRGGSDVLDGEGGRDTLDGGNGKDLLFGGGGADSMDGGGGDDIIAGGGGRDRIIDLAGNNAIIGEGGADTIETGAGNDAILGGAGNDLIQAGAGRDEVEGGRGADRFILTGSDDTTIIGDFEIGTDRIDILSGASSFADLTITQAGNRAIVEWADTRLVLRDTDAADLSADDFAFL